MEDAYLDVIVCRFKVMHDVDHTNEESIMFVLVIPKSQKKYPLERLAVF